MEGTDTVRPLWVEAKVGAEVNDGRVAVAAAVDGGDKPIFRISL